MSSRLISIIVPVLNERPSVEELCRRVDAVMAAAGETYELIFVDDGSTDGTGAEVKRLRAANPAIGLIRHQRRHGKSLALMQGFAVAEGDIAVLMDGDLQDEPEEIPAFLARIDAGYDLVNGHRARRRDVASRRCVSRIYNAFTRRLFGLKIHDINCGFKAMRKAVYKRLQLRGDMHRLIPVLAGMTLGFRVTEVPVAHAPRKHGTSKYRLLRHRGLLDLASLTATVATSWRPFHVFVETSVLPIAGMLLSGGAWVVLQATAAGLGPWGRIASTLALVGAVWCLFAATVMWVLGFLLEVLLAPLQGEAWRTSLVTEMMEPAATAPAATIGARSERAAA